MRSPWRIGAASLTWLLVCGVLGSGAVNVIGLWLLGTGMAVALNARAKKQQPTANAPLVNNAGETLASAEVGEAVSQPSGQQQSGAITDREPDGDTAEQPSEHTDDQPKAIARASIVHAPAGPSSKTEPRASQPDVTGIVVMTAGEVAQLLGVEFSAVQRAMASGRLPGNEINGAWVCNRRSLLRWLDGAWS